MTPTTIPSVFIPRVVNHKIGTHASGAGPRDFLFDDFGNGERWQISIWQGEALNNERNARR